MLCDEVNVFLGDAESIGKQLSAVACEESKFIGALRFDQLFRVRN